MWSVSACRLVSTSRTNTASKGTPFCIMKGPPAKSFHVLSVRKSFLDPTKWNSTWNKLMKAIPRPIMWAQTAAKIGPKPRQKKNCRLPPCLSIHSEACQIQQIWRARFQASKRAEVEYNILAQPFKIDKNARVIKFENLFKFLNFPPTFVSFY